MPGRTSLVRGTHYLNEGDRPIGLPRDAARAPHAAALTARILDGLEENLGVDALVAAPKVRRRRAPSDELDVDVHVCGVHVAEETSVAVAVVEPRVGLDRNAPPGRGQPLELALCLAGVALALPQLRSIDLDEPHARSAADVERVAVSDAGDRRARARSFLCLLRAACQRDTEREQDG